MNIPTNHQVITHHGVPVAVVVPYEEYTAAFTLEALQEVKEPTVPHEVAARMGVSQSAFAQMEAPESKPRMNTLTKIAAALGLTPAQIRW